MHAEEKAQQLTSGGSDGAALMSAETLERVLGTSFSPALREQCRRANLRYEEISPEERDRYVLEIVEMFDKTCALRANTGIRENRQPWVYAEDVAGRRNQGTSAPL